MANHRLLATLAAGLLCLVAVPPAWAQTPFPQEITAPEGRIVIYQPQPETLEGNVVTGRAAMSLHLNDREEPIFGAFWLSAMIEDNDDDGLLYLRDLRVTQVRWPDSDAAAEARFTAIVEAAAAGAALTTTPERLSASLADARREQESLAELKNDPPRIVFEDQLAVLLLYDGEPRWSDVDDSSYERAINTPYLVVRDKRSQTAYLSSGRLWYSAADPVGTWQSISNPPADLLQMLPEPDEDSPVPNPPPAIVVATEPTELIASDGAPNWSPIGAGELLYVTNTETPWVRELSTGQMYVLLSGRWFRAASEAGPWNFVRADQLPPAFALIPADSDLGGVRVSVAGTEEAEDALLDAAIPKTAAINRSEATLTVEYDGEPRFEPIPGTDVAQAVNTPAQVLEIDDRYYAVDNGVWFVAGSATGPWAVADEVPREKIDEIPPSSSAYNVKHVHVYQSTPEVVYVGYTPGYLWSFPYYGVPVYGTGWYYPPPPGYWYPRPFTFGFHVGYNPWTGWNFGVSWSVGFMHFGVSWGGGYRGPWGGYYGGACCRGWYGGYRPGWGGGYYGGRNQINIGEINIGNNVNFGNQTRIGNQLPNQPNSDRLRNSSVYNRPEVQARNADRTQVRQQAERARATRGDNNVFADPNGNVVRQTPEGLQARSGNQWQNIDREPARGGAQTVDRDAARARAQSIDRSSVQRSSAARQHGTQREMRQSQVPRRPAGRRRFDAPLPADVLASYLERGAAAAYGVLEQ